MITKEIEQNHLGRNLSFKVNANDDCRYDMIAEESGNVIAVVHIDDLSDAGLELRDENQEYKAEIRAIIFFDD